MEPAALRKKIIAAIQSWDPLSDSLHWDSTYFHELAAQVFRHQYTHNPVYRTFCLNREIHPKSLESVDQIPAVPTDAFKFTRLFLDTEEPAHTFRTSGTTAGARGEHHFQTLQIYRASLQPSFLRFCNPEKIRLRFLVLAPLASDLPESSLSFMIHELVQRWADPKSDHFITLDSDRNWHLDAERLQRALDQAVADQVPTMILGTAFAFAEFFERLPGSWRLPQGSRLMETGGFKGRTRTISRQELYQAFADRLGLLPSHCIGEYSMTELSSQTYTNSLQTPHREAQNAAPFFAPPWLKIQIVDPLTLHPFEETSRPGLIRFLDLANVDSVMAVQTSDRGILHPDGGLELLGRAPDAELRGCSLTIEEITRG